LLLQTTTTDYIRWGLKPSFLKYLLGQYDKIIYCDVDIFFCNSSAFCWEKLQKYAIALTPHWDNIYDKHGVIHMANTGLFNAGFVGVGLHADTINILDWWEFTCYRHMGYGPGVFVDQKFLDILPIYWNQSTYIMQHRGYNVSTWNILQYKITLQDNYNIWVNQQPLVCLHYSARFNKAIDKMQQPALKVVQKLRQYIKNLADATVHHSGMLRILENRQKRGCVTTTKML